MEFLVKTLVLHAGLPKCGSSSIQRSLYPCRELLARRGVQYWGIGPNHSIALKSLSESYLTKSPPDERSRYLSTDSVAQKLANFLELPGTVFIVSAEGMGKLRPDARQRFRAIIETARFEQIKLIAYVREPAAWYQSLVQQKTKGGSLTTALEAVAAEGASYRQLLGSLFDLFPDAERFLRIFEPATFQGGTLLQDFLWAADIPEDLHAQIEEVRANPALGQTATDFLARVQLQADASAVSVGNWFVEHYLRPAFPAVARFSLSNEVLESLFRVHHDDLAWISAQIGRDWTQLPDAAGDSGKSQPGAENELDAAANLVVRLIAELGQLKSLHFLAEAQRREKKGALRRARMLTLQALTHWPENQEAASLLERLGRFED